MVVFKKNGKHPHRRSPAEIIHRLGDSPRPQFDPRTDPSLPRRMRNQALVMAGVSLVFLVATLCIGVIIPIFEQLLQ
jgi:hypothetical protein